MNKRWSDFLFAIVVRTICGLILGGLAGLAVPFLFRFRTFWHWVARDEMWPAILWLSGWAAGGALVAVFTTPYWRWPWYEAVRDSSADAASHRYNFRRVPPELYNRMAHPSPKQFHDFVQWLREVTVAELEYARGNAEATKGALVQFFRRGFKAGLLLAELADILPSIISRVGYAEGEYSEVVTMVNGLDLGDAGLKCDENGMRFDSDAAGRT